MRLIAAIIFCLCCACTSALAQPPVVQQKPAEASVPPATQAVADGSNQGAGGELTDLEKMRALVQQMEANLAFVDTTQSPLKHQFELEISMWKLVIARMERTAKQAKPH